jgi:hypothetical protein
MTGMGRHRTPSLDWLVVAVPALLAAALCAYHLGDRSLWLDEGASYSIASQNGSALWAGIRHDGGNMLVYYLGLHLVIVAFGHGVVAMRMISLLANAATAGLVALLALALFDSRRVAVLAGGLSGLSVGLIFWGQDARGYAVMVTFTAASFYALVLALESDPDRPPPAAAIIGYIVCTAMALYVGFDAILVVPAQLLLALMLGRRLRIVIGSLAVVAALCVPLAVLAVDRGSSQLFWVPPLGATVLWQSLATLVSAGLPPNFHTTWVTIVCAAAGTGVTLVAAVVAWRSRWGGGRASLVLVPLLWLVVPAAVGVGASVAGEPVELARISTLLMPALSLLVAWLLVGPDTAVGASGGRGGRSGGAGTGLSPFLQSRSRRPRRLRARGGGFETAGAFRGVGVAALVVVVGLRVAVLVPSYGETPEPWKLVAGHVLAAAAPKDCIAFYPLDGRMPFGYYVEATPGGAARAPRAVLPRQPWSEVTPHVERYVRPSQGRLATLTAGCHRVWLISSHQGQRHGTPQSRRNFAGYVRIQAELSAIYPQHTHTSDGWASPVNAFLYTR